MRALLEHPQDSDCGGGVCVDVTNDVNNCGSCDTVCDAGETCGNGACANLKIDSPHVTESLKNFAAGSRDAAS
jgi:hypothetical protein